MCIMSKALDILCLLLVIIGAVNWGLIGFFNWNLVEALFGFSWFTRVIYALVGLAGLYCLTMFTRLRSFSDGV